MSAASYAVAFGGGVVSFLSPCVLPVVPGYLSFVTGARLAGAVDRPGLTARQRTASALRSGGLFVAGFSLVFVLLGLSASAVGVALFREHVPIERFAGVAVIAMAVSVLATTLPVRWVGDRELRFHPQLHRYGRLAAPVAGAAFALGWTPCIGPVLGSVLAVAADQHRVAVGTALLACYAAGLAVPFLVTAAALDRSLIVLRFARRHSVVLMRGAAAVLAGYGVLLTLDRLSWLTVQLQRGVTAIGLGRLIGLG